MNLTWEQSPLLVPSATSKSPLLVVCPMQEEGMTLIQGCPWLLIEETAGMLLQYILLSD
jgi:hypothetical protein